MEEQQQRNALAAAFPDPPPFFKHFTESNLAKAKELGIEASSTTESSAKTLAKDAGASEDLHFLVPPPPPADGKWRSFGEPCDLNDRLPDPKDLGIEQLYPDTATEKVDDENAKTTSEWTLDKKAELKKLAQSLLLNFLELVEILSVNPELYGQKIDDLRTIFLNIHHLLNDYRPHQARETLIMMMEQQLARVKAETEGMNALGKKVDEVLAGLPKLESGNNDKETENVEDKLNAQKEELWKLIEEIKGSS